MDNRGKKSEYSQLPVAALLCLSIVFFGLIGYWTNLQGDLSVASCDTLDNIMDQQRFSFMSKLNDHKNALETCAEFFEQPVALDDDALIAKLNTIANNSTFDYVSFVKPSGDTIENTGARLNVDDREYFLRAMAGETVVSDPVVSKVSGENIVTFATPVRDKNGSTVGTLVGIYRADNLANILMPSFNGRGYTYIVSGNGDVIVKTKANSSLALYSNLLEALKNSKFIEFDNSADIAANVAAKKSGHAHYRQDGETRRMHYAPVGMNDWYIFSVAPDDAIAPQASGMLRNTMIFLCIISLLTVAGLSYFLTYQKNYLAQLRRAAFTDTLTGISNAKRFRITAAEILATSTETHAFVLLDVDKFKVLNDTLGYTCGDSLLISISQIFGDALGDAECFGRCDSDEYFALLTYSGDATIEQRLREIIASIETRFRLQCDTSYNLVLCVGVYVITNPMEPINSISDRARHAHKLTKGQEASSVCFYNENMRRQILYEKEIENKMHSALDGGEFLLYLQPKFYLEGEKLYGAEALVRWDTGNSVIVYPDQFISVFEKNGFITKLDMYMLDKACQSIRGWLDSGITPVPVSINFSRLHLKDNGFVHQISEVVKRYDIPPNLIEIELTESTMLHNESVLLGILTSLHEGGFTLSMDDFGSGYSSLGLLKNLPVDVIKLDKSFFVDCGERKRAVTVVASIITMAKKLGIKTVAEGVETKEQVDFLLQLGCDLVQGFYYARPMAAVDLQKFMDRTEAIIG